MTINYTFLACAALALLLYRGTAVHADDVDVEHTTVSPIADMALVDTHQAMATMEPSENKQQQIKADSAQPHTIADFIIHPLIALKPRLPEEPTGEGKQATSSTTPSPWQLFGFNAGQGLGSSVSSLAGSVTGWLGNRIQLPGLLDSPISESTSTSTTTTTTTTPRPDVVVRVHHRSTRRPLIQIGNRPNRFTNDNDSEEYLDEEEDYDDEFNNNNLDHSDENSIRDHDDEEVDEEDDFEDEDVPLENEEDEEDEEKEERPVRKNKPSRRRRRPSQGSSSKRGNSKNKKRRSSNKQSNRNQKRRRPQDSQEEEDNEVEEIEEDEEEGSSTNKRRRLSSGQNNRNHKRRRPQDSQEEDDNDIEEIDNSDDDDEHDQSFYYNGNSVSTKRSQNQQNFIQRGQQSLINQIRQLTRGQSPSEVGSSIRKGVTSNYSKKRRQQATLIIKRNGQTIYLAPELMDNPDAEAQSSYIANKRPVAGYPQPPLTVAYRKKGNPTQYITIPWTQLGISPPNNNVALTEGIQSQPLILNIPQSAIEAMQNPKQNKKKPVLTSEAVPLLAEASLMDVFKPPQIPHNRNPSPIKVTKKTTASVTPVLIATKTKQRVRPGTIVEMAPAIDNPNEHAESSTEASSDADHDSESGQYILVGDDGEAGVARHAFPILGETRQYAPFTPYFNLFHARQYSGRNGRLLTPNGESMMAVNPEMKPENEISLDSPMQVNYEPSVEEADIKNSGESTKAASVTETVAIEEPIMKVAGVKMSSLEVPSKAPIMTPVEGPLLETPIARTSERVIPVHVITSDLQSVKSSEAVAE